MSGWARSEESLKRWSPVVSDAGTAGGVTAQDMPVAKPYIRPGKPVKGVPSVTSTHEDYVPGNGTWRPVT